MEELTWRAPQQWRSVPATMGGEDPPRPARNGRGEGGITIQVYFGHQGFKWQLADDDIDGLILRDKATGAYLGTLTAHAVYLMIGQRLLDAELQARVLAQLDASRAKEETREIRESLHRALRGKRR